MSSTRLRPPPALGLAKSRRREKPRRQIEEPPGDAPPPPADAPPVARLALAASPAPPAALAVGEAAVAEAGEVVARIGDPDLRDAGAQEPADQLEEAGAGQAARDRSAADQPAGDQALPGLGLEVAEGRIDAGLDEVEDIRQAPLHGGEEAAGVLRRRVAQILDAALGAAEGLQSRRRRRGPAGAIHGGFQGVRQLLAAKCFKCLAITLRFSQYFFQDAADRKGVARRAEVDAAGLQVFPHLLVLQGLDQGFDVGLGVRRVAAALGEELQRRRRLAQDLGAAAQLRREVLAQAAQRPGDLPHLQVAAGPALGLQVGHQVQDLEPTRPVLLQGASQASGLLPAGPGSGDDDRHFPQDRLRFQGALALLQRLLEGRQQLLGRYGEFARLRLDIVSQDYADPGLVNHGADIRETGPDFSDWPMIEGWRRFGWISYDPPPPHRVAALVPPLLLGRAAGHRRPRQRGERPRDMVGHLAGGSGMQSDRVRSGLAPSLQPLVPADRSLGGDHRRGAAQGRVAPPPGPASDPDSQAKS
jgi:hypothetical protein